MSNMKRAASFFAACLVGCSLWGQAPPSVIGDSWTVFLGVSEPKSFAEVPASLLSPNGKPVAPRRVKLERGGVNLAALAGRCQEWDMAALYNVFDSAKDGETRLGVSADWWMEVYANGEAVFSTMKGGNGSNAFSPGDHSFSFPVRKGRNVLAVKVLSGSSGWRFVCGASLPPRPNLKFEPGAEWKAVDMAGLVVKPGSALDLGGLSKLSSRGGLLSWLGLGSPRHPARLGINSSGKLAPVDDLDELVRLMGFQQGSFPFKTLRRDDWKPKLEAFVAAARRQGYNFMRYFPKLYNLDEADYLLFQARAQGMYLYLVNYCHIDEPWQESFRKRFDYSTLLYLGDPALRGAWKDTAGKLMNHVNPYTGLAWKDDPTIACLEFYNEQEAGLARMDENLSDSTRLQLDAKYRGWLETKYQTPAALSKAWGGAAISAFAQVVAPRRLGGASAKDNDFSLFCDAISRECATWFEGVIRSTGYQGLTSQYNYSKSLGSIETRFETSQAAIMNGYFNHPSDFSRPGSRCGQNSSVESAAGYWLSMNATRFADRPFVVTEHNHSFWNHYQHEDGLLFSAYSALQGIDAVVVHQGAVAFDAGANNDFSIGTSPVGRANEFLAACLYLRGDVKRSPCLVRLSVPEGFLNVDGNRSKAVSGEQSKLALMIGFAVDFPWAKRPAGVAVETRPDLTVLPTGTSQIMSQDQFSNVVENKDGRFSLDAACALMKAKGILPQDNLSVPSRGVFQSDTGEIVLRSHEKLMKVATPRSEAVTLEAGKGEDVGSLKIVGSSCPALVAACAVDGEELGKSGRVVLVYSTAVANGGMELSGDGVAMVKPGGLPVLMRAGKLSATLRNADAEGMSLYALGFDGSRREKLPLTAEGGVVKIDLDTAKLKDGPTTFFELVNE